MKNKIVFVCMVTMAFISFAKAQEINNRIIAGHSIGPVRIGQASKDVKAIYGNPTQTHNRSTGIKEYEWEIAKPANEYETTQYISIITASDRVIQIETNSPRFALSGGYTSNTTLAQIFQKYKNLKLSAYGVGFPEGGSYAAYYYDDVKSGVAFMLRVQDLFNHSSTPDCIIVHRPNKPATPEVNSVPAEPIANKPDNFTSTEEPIIDDGLPITEILSPEGIRGYGSSLFTTPQNVGLVGLITTSYQGWYMPTYTLAIYSFTDSPRWLGETYATFLFGGRRLRVQGEKSTDETNYATKETLIIRLPYNDFFAIVNSDNLRIEVGRHTYSFDRRYLKGLRALSTRY